MYLKSFRYMSFFSCGRGKYLDKKVRSSENAAVLEFVSVADDQDIMLYGGLVVFVQPDVDGRHQRHAASFVSEDVVKQYFKNITAKSLVSGRGSRQDLPILFDIANQPNYT